MHATVHSRPAAQDVDRVEGQRVEAAETALRRANRAYDRAASKGVIHKNNAANHKARLARSVNRQGQ